MMGLHDAQVSSSAQHQGGLQGPDFECLQVPIEESYSMDGDQAAPHLDIVAVSYRMAGSVYGLFEGTLYAFAELVPHSLTTLRHLVQRLGVR
ncbi:hypothetical protein WJX84_011693 [Apatococcus fuscideae]|uniref:Uncharacterized protein n=1 Tax=Apatococcus fuscideae TaxID=2026836 RepID=A0AAW1TG16_9CHLO